jgi:hypothetical protein
MSVERHDRGDDAGEQRRSLERHRESYSAGDLIRRADHDVMIVAREESAAEDRREYAQQPRKDE